MQAQRSVRYFLVLPAAGSGARMLQKIPKQYLPVLGKPLLQHTLEGIGSYPEFSRIYLSLAENDSHWPAVESALPIPLREKLVLVAGGDLRAVSVANALAAMAAEASADDWVLVHDCVRPCVTHADIDSLIQQIKSGPIGGILATPVRETLKRTDAGGGIVTTVDRTLLWQAATPQMFRFGILQAALQHCLAENQLVTDESFAVEHWLNQQQDPRQIQVVQGRGDNIKVTFPEDLALAGKLLAMAAEPEPIEAP